MLSMCLESVVREALVVTGHVVEGDWLCSFKKEGWEDHAAIYACASLKLDW